MITKIIKEYDTTIDNKHRITVRANSSDGVKIYKNYHVTIFGDGQIVLKPRILIDPNLLSERSLKMMDKAMANYNKGVVSKPLYIDELKEIADELPD